MLQAVRKLSMAAIAAGTLTGGSAATLDTAQAQFVVPPPYYYGGYRPWRYYRPYPYRYGPRYYGWRRPWGWRRW